MPGRLGPHPLVPLRVHQPLEEMMTTVVAVPTTAETRTRAALLHAHRPLVPSQEILIPTLIQIPIQTLTLHLPVPALPVPDPQDPGLDLALPLTETS